MDEARFRDVTFAAREIGVDRELIQQLAIAYQLAADPAFAGVAPQIFYGLARGGYRTYQQIAAAPVTALASTLEQASSDPPNQIPAFDPANPASAAADQVHRLAVQKSIGDAPAPNRASLSQVLAHVLPAAAEQTELVRAFTNNQGTTAEFWRGLATNPQFQAAGKIASTQFGLQVAALAQNRPALVDAIHASGQYKSIRDLALRTADLPSLTGRIPAEQMDDVPGATQTEKAENFAARLEGILQLAFPTETVAGLLDQVPAQDDPARKRWQNAAAVLRSASAPDGLPGGDRFDIRTTPATAFFDRYQQQLLGGLTEAEQKQALADVKRAQRVFRVSASPMTFSVLMAEGFTSGRSIAQMPRASFVAQYKDKLGGAAVAELIHNRSLTATATGLQFALAARESMTDANLPAMGDAIKQMPSWAQIFGGADLCDCEECQSVIGPAAYLVSLLEYLRHSQRNDAGLTPLDVLIGVADKDGNVSGGRRPDLAFLQLNCENTNTTIPYVDLANEVMESYVVHDAPDRGAAHDVDGRTAQELLANPQYIQDAAYAKLQNAVYPPGLPFDRSLEAIRGCLEQLQTNRLTLMTAFAPPGAATPQIVAETLGLSAREYQILTGKRFDGTDAGIDVKDLYGYIAPAPADPPESLGEQVRPVRQFLARTGLTYVELIDLVKLRFVNPAQRQFLLVDNLGLTADEISALTAAAFAPPAPATVAAKLAAAGATLDDLKQWWTDLDALVVLFSPGAECNLDETLLQRRDQKPLDDQTLLNLHRVVRLQRKLGWETVELDQALVARGYAADPVSGLRDLGHISALSKQTGMTVRDLLAFWSNLDSFADASTYQRLFANRAIVSDGDTAFRLNAARDEVDRAARGAPDKLSDQTAPICGALRIRARDLALIETDAQLNPSDALNLAHISALYRYAAAARGLNVPLRLLIELRRLDPDEDPFQNPAQALAFTARSAQVQNVGLDTSQLAYWCRHEEPGGLLDAKFAVAAQNLNQALFAAQSKANDERSMLLGDPVSAQPGQATADQTRDKLAQVFDAGDLQTAVDIVEGVTKLSTAAQAAFIADPNHFARFMDPAAAAAALPVLGPIPDPVTLQATLIARRIAILQPLLAFLERQMVRQTVAQAAGVGLWLVAPDAGQPILLAGADPTKPILDDFTAPAAVLSDERRAAYLRLSIAGAILSAFSLNADEASFFATHAADFGGFDLNQIPIAPAAGTGMFRILRALLDYTVLRGSRQGAPVAILDCFRAGADAARVSAAALISGVTDADVQQVLSGLDLTAASLTATAGLDRVLGVLDLAQAAGADASKLLQWSGDPSPGIAAVIKNALKAKYNDGSWYTIGQPISDPLREEQRAALNAYLLTLPSIQKRNIGTADQLFEFFLIDTQMTPAMQTSRIKQAISSVQLFVQRCFLNLEPAVRPDALDGVQWEFRKNFRVWQAGAQVFLQPHYYLDVEFRDDKSPFFREFESELLQGT
jgi:hypothetical protein